VTDFVAWGNAEIQRSNLDGSGVEDLGINGLEHPFRIAVDAIGEKIYWTDRYTNKIQRANLDGSDVEDLITTGLYDPFGIALDTASGKMYWTDQSYHEIKRANFAGSEVEELVYLGVERVPCGIALAIPKPAIEAAIDMDPNTLNLKSKGKWVTCYICLPEDYDVADVNCYSIVLEDEIEAKWIWVEDQEQVVIAKFRRSEIQEMLAASDQLGELEAYEMQRLPSGMFRYSAPEGMHDDCVMALALAWQAATRRPVATCILL